MQGKLDRAPVGVGPFLPTLDLNEMLLDHPAASFIFRYGDTDDLLIVDCAAVPDVDSLVIVNTYSQFSVEFYTGQDTWGVITYHLHKTS